MDEMKRSSFFIQTIDCRSFWNEANFNAQQHPKDTRSNKTMNLGSDKFPK